MSPCIFDANFFYCHIIRYIPATTRLKCNVIAFEDVLNVESLKIVFQLTIYIMHVTKSNTKFTWIEKENPSLLTLISSNLSTPNELASRWIHSSESIANQINRPKSGISMALVSQVGIWNKFSLLTMSL